MADVLFTRTDRIDEKQVIDGQIIFDTLNNRLYLDNGTDRLPMGGGEASVIIPLTQAQYDLLTPDEKNKDVIYIITDASSLDAVNIPYNNEVSQLEATNVQGAIDEVKVEVNELNESLTALDERLNWKLLKKITALSGETIVDFKDSTELLIRINAKGVFSQSFIVPISMLTASRADNIYCASYYYNSNTYGCASIAINNVGSCTTGGAIGSNPEGSWVEIYGR